MASSDSKRDEKLAVRAVVCLLFGVIVAVAVHTATDFDACAYLLTGWVAAAVPYVGWTWAIVSRMDWERTRSHATREDSTHFGTVVFIVIASLASLVAVTCLLRAGSKSGLDAFQAAAVSVGSVAVAWVAVHTVFALHYARLYYSGTTDGQKPMSPGDDGGVDFNDEKKPSYTDFAYMASTIGMAYAVSDTALKSHSIRMAALWHAIASYVLGAVILAATINLVSGLAH